MNRRRPLRNLSVSLGLSTIVSRGIARGDAESAGHAFVRCRPGIRHIAPNGRRLTSVAFSPDGSQLLTTAEGAPLKVWDAETGRMRRELGRLPADAQRVLFSPDGRRIAASGPQKYVAQKPRRRVRLEGGSVPLSAVGGLIKVFVFETGRELAEIRSERAFDAFAFEPDGSHLTTIDAENLLQSWKVDGAREFQAIPGTFPEENRGRAVSPRCLAFGAGARRAAVAMFEANGRCGAEFCPTLKCWDLDASR